MAHQALAALVVRPHTHSLLCKRQRKHMHVDSLTDVTSEASNSILQSKQQCDHDHSAAQESTTRSCTLHLPFH